jgi:hypothetical protein
MKNMNKAFLAAFGFILFLIFCQLWLATPLKSEESGFSTDESDRGSNKAVTVNILSSSSLDEIARQKTLEGKVYIILNTTWENIHPKQKVEKSKLEGKTDRSMGVGGLRGGGTAKKEEYIDMDVAYLIKSIYDHAYLLADGLAYPLHQATEELPGGINIFEPFALQKLGDKKDVSTATSSSPSREMQKKLWEQGVRQERSLERSKPILSRWLLRDWISSKVMQEKHPRKDGIMLSSNSAAKVYLEKMFGISSSSSSMSSFGSTRTVDISTTAQPGPPPKKVLSASLQRFTCSRKWPFCCRKKQSLSAWGFV